MWTRRLWLAHDKHKVSCIKGIRVKNKYAEWTNAVSEAITKQNGEWLVTGSSENRVWQSAVIKSLSIYLVNKLFVKQLCVQSSTLDLVYRETEWPIHLFYLREKSKLLLAGCPGVLRFYTRLTNEPHRIFLSTLQSRRAAWFCMGYLPTQHFWHHLVSGIFADTANFLNGNGNEYIIYVGEVSIWKYYCYRTVEKRWVV